MILRIRSKNGIQRMEVTQETSIKEIGEMIIYDKNENIKEVKLTIEISSKGENILETDETVKSLKLIHGQMLYLHILINEIVLESICNSTNDSSNNSPDNLIEEIMNKSNGDLIDIISEKDNEKSEDLSNKFNKLNESNKLNKQNMSKREEYIKIIINEGFAHCQAIEAINATNCIGIEEALDNLYQNEKIMQTVIPLDEPVQILKNMGYSEKESKEAILYTDCRGIEDALNYIQYNRDPKSRYEADFMKEMKNSSIQENKQDIKHINDQINFETNMDNSWKFDEYFQILINMGYSKTRSKEAIVMTQYKGVEEALNYLLNY